MDKQKFKNWWTKHRKKVYAAGTIIVVAGAGYILFKNKDTILSLVKKEGIDPNHFPPLKEEITAEAAEVIKMETITDATPQILNGGEPFTVRMHFRDLGENRHPSFDKIIAAQALGIELADNQTFVVEYTKNRPTAA